MYIYVLKKKTGEIVAVNRSLRGCALELYSLDVEKINESQASESCLEQELSTAASVECRSTQDDVYVAERHYLGA
jgi:hypothetical protein